MTSAPGPGPGSPCSPGGAHRAQRRRAERHLIGCGDCRSRLDGLRRSVGLLRVAGGFAVPLAEPRPLWPDLAREIRERRRERPIRFPLFRPIPLGLAACLALVAFGSWTAVRPGGPLALGPKSSTKAARPAPTPPVAAPVEETAVADSSPEVREARPSSPNRPAPNPGTMIRPPAEATH